MFHYHHTVTVGGTSRIPFECDACRFQGTACVTLTTAGYAESSKKHDAAATQRATAQATSQLQRWLPRIAAIAACPACGQRSAAAIADARRRGRGMAIGGVVASAVGLGLALVVGGQLGWILGAVAISIGLILAPLGWFTVPMSCAGSDRAVRFEPAR